MNPVEVAVNYAQNPLWLLTAILASYIGWPVWNVLCGLVGVVRGWRHRRYIRARYAAFEAHGVAYRVGSPPSHAAGGAR